ncbi:MAG: hypothetical protein KGL39_51630 [Patescibacteria group bacterium]|nr:hypothetical protein [Patescibacteria group bacterium]
MSCISLTLKDGSVVTAMVRGNGKSLTERDKQALIELAEFSREELVRRQREANKRVNRLK